MKIDIICKANQLTGLYMIQVLSEVKGISEQTFS